jgi:hypothetical protein
MGMLTSLYGFALTLESFALILTLLFLRNSVLRFRRHPETKERRRQKKWGRDSVLFFNALILFFAGLAFLNLAFFIQTYRIYSIGQPIARISIIPAKEKHHFTLQIQELGQAVSDQSSPTIREIPLTGERWTLDGNIVRFHSTLSFLGLKPVYQLTRIQGSYFSIADEKSQPRTVDSLVSAADESWWKFMYKYGQSLPVIELVYGISVTQNADKYATFLVTVLPSGFALEPEKNP